LVLVIQVHLVSLPHEAAMGRVPELLVSFTGTRPARARGSFWPKPI